MAWLIYFAAPEPDALHPEGEGAFGFARTASRLHEMLSAEWSRKAA
jgi:cell division protein ZapE